MLEVAFRHGFGAFTLDIDFKVPVPGTIALFGASGSGKSTIVNVISGLLRPDTGRIVLDGHVLSDDARSIWVAVEQRQIGVVFQDARLFPHMSVESNLRYGLRRAADGGIAFTEVVDLLGLGHLLGRRPQTLSGGERQRVAIGRALLSQPRMLLMDEPLASLDGARKAEILPYLARLKTALTLPIVYVTHAPDEVARLADTLVLLGADGRVAAFGPLTEVATRGDLPFAVRDDGGAVITMRVREHDPARRLTLLSRDGLLLWVPLVSASPGAELRAKIPAREVIIATTAPEEISLHNVISGLVRAITEDSERHASFVEIVAGDTVLLARVTPDAVMRLRLAAGVPVLALVKSMSVDVLGA